MTAGAAEAAEPLVSIVTPCRNAAASLQRCLDSVTNQDYPHLEHLVVDGSSTDGTVELLERAPGIRWVSEPDSGQSEALAKGFDLAQGVILGWLNADDELLPDAIGRVVQAFSQQLQAGWVYGRAVLCRSGGKPKIEPVRAVRDLDLQFGNPIVQPSTFFRRSALDEVGPVDATLHLAMDLDLWLRFVDRGIPRVFLPVILGRMTYGDDSKTSRIDRSEFMKENFLVYLKNGWIGSAYLALGAVAAYGAMTGCRVRKHDLQKEATRVTEWARGFLENVYERDVQAAAAIEACFAEQHVNSGLALTALRHLADPAPWRLEAGRKRIAHGITKKLFDKALEIYNQTLPGPS